MHYLNQIIDQFAVNFNYSKDFKDPGDAEKIVRNFFKQADKAVCFDMGDIDSLRNFKLIQELSGLPYKVCFFTLNLNNLNPDRVVVACLVEEYDPPHPMTRVTQFERFKGKWSVQSFARINGHWFGNKHRPRQKDSIYEFEFVGSKNGDKLVHQLTVGIKCFLSAMNCTNVRKVRHDPPAKLQKARKKRGKLPLFSYYTLELTGRQGPGQSLGGTHASPRVHLRRGHPRQYAPDKWTWVQPCVVGNKDLGMVHKDYAAGEKLYENHY